MRLVLALLPALGLIAASQASDAPKTEGTDSLPVSVSAVNYSQLTDAQLFDAVNNPRKDNPDFPQAPGSAQPLYYLALSGEVYPADVTPDAVLRELEIGLEKRNYFNVIYQERAGHKPPRVDYLLRVHYGVRPWLIPSVRADRITWGNDGLVANRNKMNLIGDTNYDARTGMSQDEISRLDLLSLLLRTTGGAGTDSRGTAVDVMDQHGAQNVVKEDSQESHPFCLVVVEAFRFADVKALDKKARCAWATFIAISIEPGQKFSSVLHTMMQTAVPYFGRTTNGVQQLEVAPGHVLLGTPVEVPPAH